MDVVRALFLINTMAICNFLDMLDSSWYCNDTVGQIDAVTIFFKVVSLVLSMYSLNYLAGSISATLWHRCHCKDVDWLAQVLHPSTGTR